MRHWVMAALSLASALLLTPIAALAEEPPLRVGTAADYAPLSFAKDGELRGAEIDFARRLAADLGRPVEIVRIPWAELIPTLREGRIDIIMSGMSITPDRAESVRFCAPYLQVGQMALIRAEELAERSVPGAMARADSRVGFVVRTTSEQLARGELAGAKLVGVASVEEGVAALRAGKLDYFLHDAPTIWRVVGGFASDEYELTGLYTPLTEEHLAWAVRRDDTELATRADAALAGWQRDGFVERVLDRWIPVRKLTRPPAAGER